MDKKIILSQLNKLQGAIKTLIEAIEKPNKSQLEHDGTIQRFEYTFELTRKTIQKVCLHLQIDTQPYPRSILKKAFQSGLIKDIEIRIDLLDTRNILSHNYDQGEAEKLYKESIIPLSKNFQELHDHLLHAIEDDTTI